MSLPRLAALIAGLSLSTPSLAAPTQYPLTVENCGLKLTFEHAPRRAVTIGQSGTEMLYELGLGDRLVGTSLWFNDVLPRFKAQNDKVERLADNDPSFEAVIGKRPELVPVQLEWMVGAQGVVGTRQQFHDLKIPTYIMPSDCEGKDNLVGADGTRLEPFRIDTIYKSIEQLAQIFDVQDRGQQLVAELRNRLAHAVANVKQNKERDVSAVFWFSSADINIDPYVAGRKGIPDFMLNNLGMRNIVESDEEWPTVGWETIAKANPDILVIARMDRRRFPADDYRRKLEFLKSDPVTRNMDAVKHDRIVIIDADAMQASIRLFTGIEELAEAANRYNAAQ
ncbi:MULTISPECIES: ABC transporter substrate-binding protein [Pseudomonas syringae group]|uniref:ABC transporter substrate-binding protein n=1 Tax=Pseudomonas lijiangensis TaxID=2995658 RepID=A0ABX8HWJ4_9PSED|nr:MULTISPECIES: ABC transporter substrate-binding protein [Pseudomonas syringae group]MBX8499252.1 ABC transporter substrate-binding protein [Pseudomonas lijiangensis]MBX8504832.1 ABC transporter substrate-binding protein [Pseudomonas lijiangensis]MBX8539720.1 ABC transporter substrate-binding protein [Pseudomonas cichorii]MBX8548608.1 ABC transporter substrate-binding protein [Pseudomonas cichorii]MBX8554273.1 ABC transporter substrate-binding protein [Pseudomonas cichorii]